MRRPRKKRWTNGWNTSSSKGPQWLWYYCECIQKTLSLRQRAERLSHWSFHNELGYKVPKFFGVLSCLKIDTYWHLLFDVNTSKYLLPSVHTSRWKCNKFHRFVLFWPTFFSHSSSIVLRCKNCSFMLWHPWFVPLLRKPSSKRFFLLLWKGHLFCKVK